jgi:hypothetical protein
VTAQSIIDQLDKLNADDPPTYDVPHYLGNFRHKCAGARNISKPIDLKELYIQDDVETELTDGNKVILAVVAREGKCKKCGQSARSISPHLVDSAERPPLTGRVSRD